MNSIGSELRVAVRSLRQTPGVSLAAIACLALGLGGATVVFSAVNTALLTPLPFQEPDRLVSIFRTTPHFQDGPFSPATVADLRREAAAIEVAALATGAGLLELPDGSDRVSIIRASGNLFGVLGVRPALGRALAQTDERPGETLALLLSDELWRRRFGADPDAIGTPVRLDGRIYTIAGVLPRGFRVPRGGAFLEGDVWIPLTFGPNEAAQRRSNFVTLVGRLSARASLGEAKAELNRLAAGLVDAFPELRGEGIRAEPMRAMVTAPLRGPLLLLLGAVGFVLLIAAANVASLLLARGAGRRREIAVRTALGATRADIVRRVLVEATLLVGGGVLSGLALAWAGIWMVRSLGAAELPQLTGVGLDARVVGFALLLAAAVTMACGLVPALRSARADPQQTLQSGSRGAAGDARQHRFLRGIASAEVSLSLVLLLGAGLALRGFVSLIQQPAGFDADPLLTLTVTVSEERYAEGGTARRFLVPLLERIRAVPGVQEAGAVSLLPYDNWGWNFNIRYEGQPPDDPTELPLVETRHATTGVFSALGITLLEGRLFTPIDEEPDAPWVVVVNRALVERDFGGASPLGKRFHAGRGFATIVGVVSDVKNFGPFQPARPEVYWNYLGRDAGAFPLVVRAAGDPVALASTVVAAVRQLDPTAAVTRVRPMTAVIADSVGRPRFYLVLLGAFAAVAVVLAMAGLYGLMSYLVVQRTREIGIRMALGSTPERTRGLVLREGGWLVARGLAAGLVLAIWLTQLLVSQLFGVSPLDPATWGVVTALLLATAGLAMLVPALRATRVDPLLAIRAE